MTAGRHPGVWPDVRDLLSRNLRENALQEPDVRANGWMSGLAGCPGLGPDFRDLMSRTGCEIALQEPDVRANGRMSGMARCPGFGPDVRAPNPRMNSRNSILGRKLMISVAKFDGFHG